MILRLTIFNTQMAKHENRLARLNWREKIGYGVGDAGFNLYWTTIASFLAAFYTDVFGLSAAAAGTMLLLTKIIDAFTDPVMGAVADRTNTRFGKFRPFLIWGSLPLAIAAAFAFTTPELGPLGKLVWAYVTYTLLMMCYTVVSTPYSALSGVLTANSQDRTTLISLRFLFAFGCGALVNRFTLPLVEYFGRGNESLGWTLTMSLYGVLACIAFTTTFASTRERIIPPVSEPTSVRTDIKDLLNSKPWVILFALAMIVMMTITLRGGSAYYFFKYYVERPDLISSYLFWQMIAYASGACLTPLLTRYVDKARLLIILMSIVGGLSICYFFVGRDQIEVMFTLNILISLALGPKSPLTWSMYADAADYNEWRNGRRATAMTFSAATFAQKLGGALGSAVMLWVLAAIGYVAKEAQTGASLLGINLLQTAVPGGFALLAVAFLTQYTLSGKQLHIIQTELACREHDASVQGSTQGAQQ